MMNSKHYQYPMTVKIYFKKHKPVTEELYYNSS